MSSTVSGSSGGRAQGPVLVLDFGAQYAQLIARRVRETQVYSEVVPHDTPVEEILRREPSALVLSGGPASVYSAGAPQVDPALFEAGVPVFGICYGFQAMTQALGGVVAKTGLGEFGRTAVSIDEPGCLLAAMSSGAMAPSATRDETNWYT